MNIYTRLLIEHVICIYITYMHIHKTLLEHICIHILDFLIKTYMYIYNTSYLGHMYIYIYTVLLEYIWLFIKHICICKYKNLLEHVCIYIQEFYLNIYICKTLY